MSAPRVVVVGGGITGLAAGLTLQDDAAGAGRAAGAHRARGRRRGAGGHVQTTRVDGFLIEAGPNGFLNREPHTLALIEALGLTSRLVEARPEAKRRYIVRGGGCAGCPTARRRCVTSPALSWRASCACSASRSRAGPPAGEESVHAFAARRLGGEAADMLVDAAVARHLGRRQPPAVGGGAVSAGWRRWSARTAASSGRCSPSRRPARRPARRSSSASTRGMGVLTAALARRLGPAITAGSRGALAAPVATAAGG